MSKARAVDGPVVLVTGAYGSIGRETVKCVVEKGKA